MGSPSGRACGRAPCRRMQPDAEGCQGLNVNTHGKGRVLDPHPRSRGNVTVPRRSLRNCSPPLRVRVVPIRTSRTPHSPLDADTQRGCANDPEHSTLRQETMPQRVASPPTAIWSDTHGPGIRGGMKQDRGGKKGGRAAKASRPDTIFYKKPLILPQVFRKYNSCPKKSRPITHCPRRTYGLSGQFLLIIFDKPSPPPSACVRKNRMP